MQCSCGSTSLIDFYSLSDDKKYFYCKKCFNVLYSSPTIGYIEIATYNLLEALPSVVYAAYNECLCSESLLENLHHCLACNTPFYAEDTKELMCPSCSFRWRIFVDE